MSLYQYADGTIPSVPQEVVTHAVGEPAPQPGGGLLPETGSDPFALAGLGILALLIGVGLTRLRRTKTGHLN